MQLLTSIFAVNVNVNVIDFATAPLPLRKFLRGAVCNMMPTQRNRDTFNARLKQSGVLVQVARVAAGNWFQSCGQDTANVFIHSFLACTIVSA